MRIRLSFLDVQLQEGLYIYVACDFHSLLTVGEVELLLLCDALSELRFVIGWIVLLLVLADDLLIGLWLSAELHEERSTSSILFSHSTRLATALPFISFRLSRASFNFWVCMRYFEPAWRKIPCPRPKSNSWDRCKPFRRLWAAPQRALDHFQKDS